MELKVGDKVKFSDQSWCPLAYFLADKYYDVTGIVGYGGFNILDEDGEERICVLDGCCHLLFNAWEKVEQESLFESIAEVIKKDLDERL